MLIIAYIWAARTFNSRACLYWGFSLISYGKKGPEAADWHDSILQCVSEQLGQGKYWCNFMAGRDSFTVRSLWDQKSQSLLPSNFLFVVLHTLHLHGRKTWRLEWSNKDEYGFNIFQFFKYPPNSTFTPKIMNVDAPKAPSEALHWNQSWNATANVQVTTVHFKYRQYVHIPCKCVLCIKLFKM